MTSTTSNTVLITGNTYPVRRSLAELGGKWNASQKGWEVPAEKEQEAKELVFNGAIRKSRFNENYVSNIFQVGRTELYRNKKGRCEDAPCCGCCNF
jgi:hypothetical protein